MKLAAFVSVLGVLFVTHSARSADVFNSVDAKSGLAVMTATQGDTTIQLAPQAGANVFSIKYRGTEIFRQPDSLKDLPGFRYGNPVLYPTPNRVRDSVMTFAGQSYKFTPNNGPNFLHGLVHSEAWQVTGSDEAADHATIHCQLDFQPGSERFKLFPHPHTVKLDVTVTNAAVRFAYTVDNAKGTKAVPFGWAFHPWFLYQGERKNTFLTVPATHVMEAKELLPTGKLLSLDGSKFDARRGISLDGFVIDDVYYGMTPEKPAEIDFRDKKLKIRLASSADFSHLVVYTPDKEPWFCVENQTCSTDAHNMHTRGLTKEANLRVCEPGKTMTGWAEFRFEKY